MKLLDEVRQLREAYIAYHANLKGDYSSLFLCLFAGKHRTKRELIQSIEERIWSLSENSGIDPHTVESLDDILPESELLCTRPDSWSKDVLWPYVVQYNRRIYFLNTWIKELENDTTNRVQRRIEFLNNWTEELENDTTGCTKTAAF